MIIYLLRALVMTQVVSFIFFLIKNTNCFNMKQIQEINEFLIFMHENNPLLLSYYDEDENENVDKNEKEEIVHVEETSPRQEFKYETKYLEKFKK